MTTPPMTCAASVTVGYGLDKAGVDHPDRHALSLQLALVRPTVPGGWRIAQCGSFNDLCELWKPEWFTSR
jgi:hypothetical protein